jgi:hypothetical protein
VNAIQRIVKSIYTAVQTLTRYPGMTHYGSAKHRRTWGEAVCPWGPFYLDLHLTDVREHIEKLHNEDHSDIVFQYIIRMEDIRKARICIRN